MKRGYRMLLGVWGGMVACLAGMALAAGQSGQPGGTAAPPMAEEVFTNVQLLRGIPVDEFMDTMGMFSAATGMNCTDCHISEGAGSWESYADETDLKRTSRMMMVMVNSLNQSYFGGRRVLTCYSCHNGGRRPRVLPNLVVQYAVAPPAEPDEITQQWPGSPSADEILDKYLQALGGAQRLAGLTSLAGEGTWRGFDDFEDYTFEVYARAPNQRTTIQHTDYGDVTMTYDGRAGWTAAPRELRPGGVVTLTGGNLEGAAVDAALSFPGRIRQTLSQWRVGPATVIDGRPAYIVQGSTAAGSPVKLYFDEESGLLLRVVRYADSPVGRVPTQIDYSDYREVSGIKLPFAWTVTWTNGRTRFKLNSLQANVPVDASRFARPAPPAASSGAR